MEDRHSNQALALAGVFQAATLVREIARQGGLIHTGAAEISVASVFATEPDSVEAVFGSVLGVRLGLEHLRDQLRAEDARGRDMELARYVIGLTVLERKVARKQGALEELGADIEAAQRTYQHFGAGHANVYGRLADIYTEHVTPLGARIMVRGDEQALREPGNVARVRALLLAGLRAAVLWRQLGGRRWQLVLSRGRYLRTSEQLLEALPVS
ncbi:high frequency lysogenization protein HflD [Thiohalorhabdus methylotrophus]|uniref:High frequency lysogenization protein HflD homolog n=1 Tax=Thiohalorhabdus methylotrophus TaxID=3242694 RepID=A0ABV4TUG6_9GAMM